jgi:hypothetical protein
MTAATDTSTGPDWEAGLSVLSHWASTGQVFSANSVRQHLRELGFGRYTTGSLFLDAEQQQIIRQVGLERSTDRPTHKSRIAQWIGAGQGREVA